MMARPAFCFVERELSIVDLAANDFPLTIRMLGYTVDIKDKG